MGSVSAMHWMDLLWISLVLALGQCNQEAVHRVKLCAFDDFDKTCSEGLLEIKSALHGRLALGNCIKQDMNIPCSQSVLPQLDAWCSGRPSCQFQVSALHKYHPCQPDLHTELEVTYICRKVYMAEDVRCLNGNNISINISENPVTVPSFVSMKTPKGTSQCPWFIHTTPGQRINITLTNFNRFSEDASGGVPDCYQFVRVVDSGKEAVIAGCGRGARDKLVYTSISDSIQVQVLTRNDVFFFLEFTAAGCYKNWPSSPHLWIRQEGNEAIARCNNTGEQWKLTCVESQRQWVGTLGDCPVGYTSVETESFPYGILVVVAIGVALGVFLGGLLLICAARVIRRKQKPCSHTEEVHYAPATDYIPREELQQYASEPQKCSGLSGTYERCRTIAVASAADKEKYLQHQCYGTLPPGYHRSPTPVNVFKSHVHHHLDTQTHHGQEPRDPV